MKRGTVLPNLQSIRGLGKYDVSFLGENAVIYRTFKGRNGCFFKSEQLFQISKKDEKIVLTLEMLETGPIPPTKICDGLDFVYRKKRLYVRGYYVTGETFLIDEYGNNIEEYEDIPYIA